MSRIRIRSLVALWLALIAPSYALHIGTPIQKEDTCTKRGDSCNESSDCCRGACRKNLCRPCIKLNRACTTSDECCGKKVCSAVGLCIKMAVAPNPVDPPVLDSGSWPEAVDKTGDEAKALILATNPKLYVEILHKDAPATEDWRDDRVRVRVDDAGIVVEIPVIG